MAIENNVLKNTTFAKQLDTANQLLASIAMAGGGITLESFADIQAAVRAGVASQFFKVGDQISVSNGSNTLVWDIIGIDEDIPANPSLKHSMTLQLHDLWPTAMVYDAPEATWYIDSKTWPSGLPAGVYQFTLPAGYDTANGGGGTYNFTLTKPVPTGGQVKVGWNYNTQVTANKVTTYASVGATDILESVDIVSGATGTAMPALSTTAVTSNTNCVHRMRYGSNNWKQSGMRQWLNSDGAANTWWKAQTVFDRPTNASSAGFLNGMDAEFLAVIGEVRKDTKQSISDNYGINNNKEKFFLLSRPEAYMGIERSTDGSEGTVYSFYKDYSDLTAPGTGKDNNRIKYRSGGATYWWLRSPIAGDGSNVRYVYPDGCLNVSYASGSYGVAPACCII